MKTRREKLLVALLVIVATLAYVSTHSTFRLAIADDKLAAGVRHRAFLSGRLQTIDVVDVDLSTSVYRPRVLVDGVVREDADMTGAEPHTAAERVNDDRALAAVNGGFFGQTRHDGRIELVGVLVRDHKIINPTHDAEDASPAYARCALGIDDEGMPHIRWASTLTYGADALDKPDQDRLLAYDTPAAPTDPAMWRMRDVIGCAPRIVVRGRVRVPAKDEHYDVTTLFPRTFVAYDLVNGRPQHFVMGVASKETFESLASFLVYYFRRYGHTRISDAMCLDGGPSSQLAFRLGGAVENRLSTDVRTPDSLALVAR